MTVGQCIALIIFGFFGGICTGQLIGQAMHYSRIKKISQTKCRNCKFFYECQGVGMKHLDEKNDCKTFQPAEPEASEVENLINAFKNLSQKVEENSDDINSLYTIASDNDNAIQEVSKAVFDNDKKKPNSNTER